LLFVNVQQACLQAGNAECRMTKGMPTKDNSTGYHLMQIALDSPFPDSLYFFVSE